MAPLLDLLRPDVHCKGTDYTADTVPERETVRRLRRPHRHRRRSQGSFDAGSARANPRMNILIVRLGALGDIIHAVPAAAAIRRAHPDARIDWLVDARHRHIIDLITVVDRAVVTGTTVDRGMDGGRRGGCGRARYDVAIDFQGLMKSAVLARASGAARVIGFSIWHLREKTARPFYSETETGARLPRTERITSSSRTSPCCAALGIQDTAHPVPARARGVARAGSSAHDARRRRPFALINPGAAWPNKRWPPERFGEVAAFLRDVRGLPSFALWGPGEEGLAGAVAETSGGAARVAPATSLTDLLALSRAASLMVSGDTGPLHIAAAAGTPTVALFGPTDPHRNGPWAADDVAVSRYGSCGCHYERRCRKAEWCLEIDCVAEVTAAIQQRFHKCSSFGVSDRRGRALRVPIGFVSSVFVLWLAHPTWRTLAIGAAVALDRRSGSRLGCRASRERARSHDVRAVRLHATSTLSSAPRSSASGWRSRRTALIVAR